MTLITSTGAVARIEDDVHGSSTFFYRNNEWNSPFHRWGNPGGKGGLYLHSFWKFILDIPIAPFTKIISAKVRGVAESSEVGNFFTIIQATIPDGGWELLAPVAQWRRKSQPPLNSDFRLRVQDTGGGDILNFVLAFSGGGWEMRANLNPGRFDRLGQGFEAQASGPLGFVTFKLGRTAVAPVGNVWAEMYTRDADGLADALIATSNTRAASQVSTAFAFADFIFTFPVGQQPTLTDGVGYVAVLRGDYPITESEFVSARWEGATAGISSGWPQVFGFGIGFDDSHYPMDENFRNIPRYPPLVVWVAPPFTAGVSYDTPDLTIMIQNVVDQAVYSSGDAFGIAIVAATFLLDAGDERNFKSPGAELIITWQSFRAIDDIIKLSTAAGGRPVRELRAPGQALSSLRADARPTGLLKADGSPVSQLGALGSPVSQLRARASQVELVELSTANGGQPLRELRAPGLVTSKLAADANPIKAIQAPGAQALELAAAASRVSVLRALGSAC